MRSAQGVTKPHPVECLPHNHTHRPPVVTHRHDRLRHGIVHAQLVHCRHEAVMQLARPDQTLSLTCACLAGPVGLAVGVIARVLTAACRRAAAAAGAAAPARRVASAMVGVVLVVVVVVNCAAAVLAVLRPTAVSAATAAALLVLALAAARAVTVVAGAL
eukprot:353354-Chlamydomonas_euryale.AAC.1